MLVTPAGPIILVAIQHHSLRPLWLLPVVAALYYSLSACCMSSVALRGIGGATGALLQLGESYNLNCHIAEEYINQRALERPELITDVIVVSAEPKEITTPPLASLKAYLNPSGISLIIVSDPPDRASDYTQFFVYHECGHLSTVASAMKVFNSSPWFNILAYALPMALLIMNVWARCGLVALMWIGSVGLDSLDEITADFFALRHIMENHGVESAERMVRLVLHNCRRMMSHMTRRESLLSGTTL
jgi:hypothetical protein